MKRLIPLFLLVGLTCLPADLLAQPAPGRAFERLEARKGKLIQELNLSQQQQQQIETIRQQRRGEIESLKQRMQQLRQEMDQLLSTNAPESSIRAKFTEIQAVKQKMAEVRFEQMLATREVLTPEQRVKFRELASQRQNRRRPGGGLAQ
jgi:Spy/CpxP family protein refolding chaperone